MCLGDVVPEGTGYRGLLTKQQLHRTTWVKHLSTTDARDHLGQASDSGGSAGLCWSKSIEKERTWIILKFRTRSSELKKKKSSIFKPKCLYSVYITSNCLSKQHLGKLVTMNGKVLLKQGEKSTRDHNPPHSWRLSHVELVKYNWHMVSSAAFAPFLSHFYTGECWPRGGRTIVGFYSFLQCNWISNKSLQRKQDG